jgi:hypothetical protein
MPALVLLHTLTKAVKFNISLKIVMFLVIFCFFCG